MASTLSPTATPVLTSPSQRQLAPHRPDLPPNVSNVVLGNLHIKPWYPSFYPEETLGGKKKVDWLYVCQWCFRYTGEVLGICGHCKVCPLKDEPPPGEVIYEKDGYAIHELDGEDHKLYTQNLSLFAKLFLETKSVFFDSSTFLYYTLVLNTSTTSTTPSPEQPQPSQQVVGFFSKEKMSWDNNNIACILIFPPWQKRGLGQILIAASYELGRREGRFGGPERPLSKMGRKGYIAFWCGEVARCILNAPGKKSLTVREISEATYILPEDVAAAVREMDVCETRRKTAGGSVVVKKERVRQWAERTGVKLEPLVDVEAFTKEYAELDGSGDESMAESSEG